jgi:hypothetical protein
MQMLLHVGRSNATPLFSGTYFEHGLVQWYWSVCLVHANTGKATLRGCVQCTMSYILIGLRTLIIIWRKCALHLLEVFASVLGNIIHAWPICKK